MTSSKRAIGKLAVEAGVGVVAAFIHVASELTFILNSARLLPARASDTAGAKQLS